MSRRKSAARHDWLSLVRLSGLVISEPVLEEHFPQGIAPMEGADLKWFRRNVDRHRAARENCLALLRRGKDPQQSRQTISRFVNYVLETFLDHPLEAWLKRGDIPDSCRKAVPSLQQELQPSRVLVRNGKPSLLVDVVPPELLLDKRDPRRGRWKVTPSARLERLLRETGHPLGLVSNGQHWRLLFCPPRLSTGWIEWETDRLYQEPSALSAFRALLGQPLLRPSQEEAPTLDALCRLSLERQQDEADQLGKQVRDGLEILLWELDEADRRSHGRLLQGLSDDSLYEMLLAVMMRLLFLLYAEERGLLPHGQMLYDQGYGITYLWQDLQRRRESLDEEYDAWERLLGTFRIVHQGCRHPDLSLKPYGGMLFDPNRYPALESSLCRIRNKAVHGVLDRLLYAPQGRGKARQRVAYWSLDVEEIGYLYEGLLDHRAACAGQTPLVKLQGAGEEAIPITELEERSGQQLHDYVLERIRRPKNAANRRKLQEKLEEGPGEDELRQLAYFQAVSPETARRARPYAPILQCDELVPPGRRCLTTGASRRTSGSFYTPQHLTSEVVETTLQPLVYLSEEGKPGKYVLQDGEKVLKPPREILALKVCDMAMGSGAFLVQVVRYLGERLVESWDRALVEAVEGEKLSLPFAERVIDPARDPLIDFENREALRLEARRLVASRCVYGVDKNPLATEMAKLSLWLVTLGRDFPFTFLDHALKSGDSLVGVSRKQMERWSFSETGPVQFPLGLGAVQERLHSASEKRRQIESKPVQSPDDEQRKRQLLDAAEEDTKLLRLAGDLLLSPEFSEEKLTDRTQLRQRLLEAYQREEYESLRSRARQRLTGLRPFHWFLEFPEVFDEEGFHALVGNPPFMGGQKITGALGTPYRHYLVECVAGGRRGSSDLCAYFFLNAYRLLRLGGAFGLMATNTIAQGDTREVGLEQLEKRGAEVYQAVSSRKWPGTASLEVAEVWVRKGEWSGQHMLDGEAVRGITAFLSIPGRVQGKPHRLAANAGMSFQGSIVLGMGFVMLPEEARALIQEDPRNREVLLPYLNGKDLNSSPHQSPSRWIINFFDWPLERTASGSWENEADKERQQWLRQGVVPEDYPSQVARDYPRCIEIVEKKVKPARLKLKRKVRRERWWQYAERAPALYEAIAGMGRILLFAQTSKTKYPALVRNGAVFDQKLVVIASDSYGVFGLLCSHLHYWWVLRLGSTLRSDAVYTPSDCFENFPFPQELELIKSTAQAYELYRAELMRKTEIGLTKLYGQFHDRRVRSPFIDGLRERHVRLDQAVLAAYGWCDVKLDHGFYETQVGPRFTISPLALTEVLDRLVELDHERYRKEVEEGLHEKEQKAQHKTKRVSNQATLF
ncbi:MAG: type IIL restriction-modification enzyme MmeI [Acidobacteriota bacterium]